MIIEINLCTYTYIHNTRVYAHVFTICSIYKYGRKQENKIKIKIRLHVNDALSILIDMNKVNICVYK